MKVPNILILFLNTHSLKQLLFFNNKINWMIFQIEPNWNKFSKNI